MASRILSTGSYLPALVVTNEFFPSSINYSDDMQALFDGTHKRRHASETETSVYMGTEAAKAAIKAAGIVADEIDLILCFSMFPDNLFPNDGCYIARNLEIPHVPAWSIDTVCSSFITMVKTADALIHANHFKKVLVICVNSWVTRGLDRSKNYSANGDGAAAVIIEACENPSLVAAKECAHNEYADYMGMSSPLLTNQKEYFRFGDMKGVTQTIVKRITQVVRDLMVENKIFPNSIDWFILHQPGQTMLDQWCAYNEIPREKCLDTFSQTANIGAANLPTILDIFFNEKKLIERGDTILFFAPGVGMHMSAMLWKM